MLKNIDPDVKIEATKTEMPTIRLGRCNAA